MRKSSVTSAFESSILARVTAAIQAMTFLRGAEITATSRFHEDLNLNQLDVMKIVIRIEEAFDTEFPADALVRFQGVPDVVRYLSRRFFPDAAELTHSWSA